MLLVTHDLEEAEAMGDWICTCSRLDGILEIKRNRQKQHRNLKRKETDFLCCFCCESAVTAGHPVWKQSGAVRPSCR